MCKCSKVLTAYPQIIFTITKSMHSCHFPVFRKLSSLVASQLPIAGRLIRKFMLYKCKKLCCVSAMTIYTGLLYPQSNNYLTRNTQYMCKWLHSAMPALSFPKLFLEPDKVLQFRLRTLLLLWIGVWPVRLETRVVWAGCVYTMVELQFVWTSGTFLCCCAYRSWKICVLP